MMALYVLSQKESTNFKSVLDWTARYDPYPLNRQMAVALGGTPPAEIQPQPADMAQTDPNQ
jgi:hypothetical protein